MPLLVVGLLRHESRLEVYALGMNWWGNTIDHSGSGFRLASLIYVHYNNKFVELLDTLFMVLRKKNKQVSVLHVYHHVMLIWAWFLVCRFHCGGDAYFGAMANSFIHVVMKTRRRSWADSRISAGWGK